ncbi:MAG: helix-turn-helix domain-containing protein [Chloroflexota bacterium]
MTATIAPDGRPVLINRLSRLVGERRLTVKDVAEGSGISYRTLHDLYHARTTRIDLETLNKLCAFFDVEPGQIFEWRRGEADPAPTTPAE